MAHLSKIIFNDLFSKLRIAAILQLPHKLFTVSIIRNLNWDNGGIVNAGAITYGSGNSPFSGEINSQNSVLGTAANGGANLVFSFDYSKNQLVVGRPDSNIISLFRNYRSPYDFDEDGKTDIAIWRPSTGEWFILRSEDFSFYAVPFGIATDLPTPGDYDGDGKYDTAVFRPSDSTWYVNRSTAGTLIQTFGIAGDRPVPSVFIP